MINTHLLQLLAENKPLGFTRFGGTMRYYLHKMDATRTDWEKTIDYAISRGWIVETGQFDARGLVYDWKGK